MIREEAIQELEVLKENYWDDDGYGHETKQYDDTMLALDMAIKALEQEPQTFKWCTNCKEYDQEKHCCHRWSKVIRNTVEEMKQEQEPILNKIRAEIESIDHYGTNNGHDSWLRTPDEIKKDALVIIDKYKAETEDT